MKRMLMAVAMLSLLSLAAAASPGKPARNNVTSNESFEARNGARRVTLMGAHRGGPASIRNHCRPSAVNEARCRSWLQDQGSLLLAGSAVMAPTGPVHGKTVAGNATYKRQPRRYGDYTPLAKTESITPAASPYTALTIM